ncbi:carboxypeptidase regulatory-like domain-containing protein, partial [Metabacillus fastidiosus]|uniref:carboxypeptidase regulatory-like domain-containing protein n=1 Tax=Metabacillus fastidiosus TaxID=1458 RepID=UPI002E239051|nr:carboxypeptidase regulatory-like domain-containing protein [Metabacillus fastidiosus]
MVFPNNAQYTPILINGAPLFDNIGDESPAATDIVGNSTFPAGFFAYDGTNVYFRLRLNTDPRNNRLTSFQNFAWGVLINTSGVAGTYDWLFNVNGLNNTVNLIQNTNKLVNSWNDPAEGTGNGNPNFSQPISNFDFARVTQADSNFGGDPDYFLDWFLPASTLFSFLGINANSLIRTLYFTSANANNYNKDSLQTNEGFSFANAFSEQVTSNATDVRAKLTTTKTLTSGPASILLGQTATWTGTITVSNPGLSQATTVLTSDIVGLDIISNFTVNSLSQGLTAYNATSRTLTWNIGNLNANTTATLNFTVTGSFTNVRQDGEYVLDRVRATGVDNFTGNTIQSNNSVISINVQQAAAISGTIINQANGTAIPNATVTLLQNGNPVATTASNSSGLYSFTNVTPGSYTISVNNPPNFSPNSVNINVANGQSLTQNIFLTPVPSTIQGTITSNGNPIPNATVTLTNNSGILISQTTTNVAGSYSFENIPPSSYTVSVLENTFQSQTRGVITGPGQTVTANFTLQPNPGSITGTVTNALTSASIAGATVQLLNNQGVFLDSTITNSNGAYTFAGLAPAQYLVRASAPDFGTNTVSSSVTSNTVTTTNILLQPNPGTITGTLTDLSTGAVVSGATIQLINSLGLIINTAVTDGNGVYVFNNVLPGSYNLSFIANGYSNGRAGAIVNSNQTTIVNASLTRLAGSLSGTVLNNNNEPVAGAQITVFQNNIQVASAITDANGNYLIPNLSPGSYVVVTTADNFITNTVSTTITNGETTVVNFSLQPLPGTLSGQITDSNGNPIAGATVSIQLGTGAGIAIGSTATNSNGTYTITGLAPGNYIVNASAFNFQTAVSGASISSNITTIVNLALAATPGSITGQITNAETGTPIIGANIEVRVLDSSGAVISTVLSDQSGKYLVNGLAPGPYTLIISSANFQTTAVSEIVTAGQTTAANISLNPSPGSISGTVVNSQDGTPIGGASVNIINSKNALITTVLTGQDGTFIVNGLSPDQYTLTFFSINSQNGSVGVVVQSNLTTPVTASLIPEPGTISGTVSPAVIGTNVRLVDNNGIFIDSVVVNPDGSFQFSNLTPGSYTLSATVQGYAATTAGATVLANQTSDVALTLIPNPGTVSGTVISSDNEPLSNTLVQITTSNGTIIGSAFTNSQGQYTITNVPTGSYNIKANVENFSPAVVGVTVGPGENVTNVNFSLTPNSGSLNGQIINSQTGEVIGGARIIIRDTLTQTIIASTTSTTFGNYIINDLPPGSVTVTAVKNGFGTASIGAIIASNESTTADLSLSPNTGTINGTIVDTNGNMVTSNNIEVQIFNENKILVTTVTANNDGTYTVSNLPPGNYFVTVTAPGFASSTVTVQVRSDTATSITNIVTPLPVQLTVNILNDATGEPITGASVTVRHQNGIIIATRITDQNGQTVFTSLPSGSLVITADALSFGTASTTIFANNGDVLNTTLSLSPNPGNLTGFVSNIANGDPIPNAVVQLFDFTNTLIQTAVSDQFGRYSFQGISPGVYTVITNAVDFGQQSAGAVISSDEISILSFALTPNPGTIQGFVTNALTGAPVQGATIVIRELSNTGPIVTTTITDQNGFYETATLAPLIYILIASEPNFGSVTASAQVISNTTQRVDFQLTPNPGGIQGTVTHIATGLPLTNSFVRVLNTDGSIITSTQVDLNGNYVITGLTPGTYTVTAINLDYQPGIQTVSIASNTTQTVDFALTGSPAIIQGTVTDSVTGNPLVGAIIEIFDEETKTLLRRVLTNEIGFYRADGLPAGTVSIITSFNQYANATNTAILQPNQTVSINIPLNPFPAAVSGTVIDNFTSNPISGVLVQLVIPKTDTVIASTFTTNDGTYNLVNLPQGTFDIIFSADNFSTSTAAVILEPGETEIVNNTLIPNPATVTGTVTDTLTGNLLANALVEVFDSRGTFISSVLTDINGQYTISRLPEGTLTIQASSNNFASQVQTVTLTPGETKSISFTLTPDPASLNGTVTETQNGNPIAGALVQAFLVGTTIPVRSTLTDSNGNYGLTGLNEGEYRIEIS